MENPLFAIDGDFGSDFGSNLAPFWCPRSTKIFQKYDLKRHQKFDRFLHRFFFEFPSVSRPKTAPGAPQRVPRRPQEAAKRPPKNIFPPPFFGHGRQEAPRAPRDPSKSNFWSIFDRFFDDFLSISSLSFSLSLSLHLCINVLLSSGGDNPMQG